MNDNFELVAIGSSSDGNAYLIKLNDDVILVECGFPKNHLLKETLYTPLHLQDAKACIVTHGHKDHCYSINDIKKMMPTFAGLETLRQAWKEEKARNPRKQTIGINENSILQVGQIKMITEKTAVIPIAVNHDFEDSLGFIIVNDDLKVLFVNDCSSIISDISNWRFDYIFIECNYVDQLLHIQLNEYAKGGEVIKYRRLERVKKYHMGLSGTRKILKSLDLKKTKAIFLMHLSDNNANVKMIREDFEKNFLNKKVFICRKYGGID